MFAGKSPGRTWSLFAVGIAVVGFVAVYGWQVGAQASPNRAADLKATCERGGAHHTRGAALRDLVELDSAASHEALEALADATDDRLASQAIAALGRAGYAGAKTKLASIVADEDRSEFVRSMAITAALRAEKRDGATKTSVRSAFATECGKSAALDDAAKATRDHLWGAR